MNCKDCNKNLAYLSESSESSNITSCRTTEAFGLKIIFTKYSSESISKTNKPRTSSL